MIIDNYLRIITDARNIDIFDLVPDGGCESLKRLYLGKAWHPRKGIITRLVSFSYRYLNCVVKQLIIRKSRMPKGNVLFFVVSKNEKDALDPIFNVLHNSFMTNCNSEAENEFPFSFAYLISLFYIPWLLKKFRDSIGYRRMSFKYYIDFYLCTYGMYVVSRFFLKKYKPTAIIVSNDLSVWCRALCKAAVDEGIKTFYVQHASVSGDEPALIFNYALLEGFNALFKYNKSGMTKTKIFLIGMAKNDRYYKYINHSKIVRTIGICTN